MSATARISEQKQFGFKHILIATDFSPASERATDCALGIARRYGSQVTLVHALLPKPREPIPMDSPRDLDRERFKAEQRMTEIAGKMSRIGVSSRLRIERGRIWDVLSSLIQLEDIDLLVLGTHGRGGIKKIALGSVAEQVLHQAGCPVLTIGPNVPSAASSDFLSILFATDFGPASEKAFPYALSLAEGQGARLVFVHMIAPVPTAIAGFAPAVCAAQDLAEWEATAKRESVRKLYKLIPRGTKLEMPPEYVVGLGFLPNGILDTAAEHDVDLIVMGANRIDSARFVSHIPWAVTHDVICQARCPVLTVSG
ncbi:MAG TPA: universal stress protein [Terriglobales bacterium]|jgi:nucleotide-binding universal stress UspA family protein|nr:universal stress protein [Terriglobales bacterium]